MDVQEILEYRFLQIDSFYLDLYKVLAVVVLYFVTRFALYLVARVMNRSKRLDTGRKHSLMLIIRYVVWVLSIALMLETVGIKVTFLLAGSAALAVGIGLGMQQLFNDLASGVFLLFEGTVEVGDVLEVDGVVGEVRKIRLRTTELLTRDDTILIVPNHKFVTEKVLNWSHNYEKTRFAVTVGVAYGSNVELVTQLMLECAEKHPQVSNKPAPMINMVSFGDSALEMVLYFWSEDPFGIEMVRSDLRFAIDKAFREARVVIPFPQRDLHIRPSNAAFPMAKEDQNEGN
ncbi:MAG: mechanosensitive ion channel family protein [Salibacteraceae bacterium]